MSKGWHSRWRPHLRIALLIAIATALSCGGDGGDAGVLADPSVDPAGQWSVAGQISADSCGGLEGLTDQFDVLITRVGDTYYAEAEGAEDECGKQVLGVLTNNSFSGQDSETITEALAGGVSCTYRRTTSWTVNFTQTSLSDSAETVFELVSGECSILFDTLPCSYRWSASGTRCASCYDGCPTPAFVRSQGASRVPAARAAFGGGRR